MFHWHMQWWNWCYWKRCPVLENFTSSLKWNQRNMKGYRCESSVKCSGGMSANCRMLGSEGGVGSGLSWPFASRVRPFVKYSTMAYVESEGSRAPVSVMRWPTPPSLLCSLPSKVLGLLNHKFNMLVNAGCSGVPRFWHASLLSTCKNI